MNCTHRRAARAGYAEDGMAGNELDARHGREGCSLAHAKTSTSPSRARREIEKAFPPPAERACFQPKHCDVRRAAALRMAEAPLANASVATFDNLDRGTRRLMECFRREGGEAQRVFLHGEKRVV